MSQLPARAPAGHSARPGGVQTTPPAGPATILIVEDDATVSEVLAKYLERAGHDVHVAADGPTGTALTRELDPDLVVLDLMLPGFDGEEVFRRLRERSDAPVVMLTARGDEEDRISGLEIGAEDYITKPFSPREVVLRVGNILRRSSRTAAIPGTSSGRSPVSVECSEPMGFDGLVVNCIARTVTCSGRPVELTSREFDLLAFLCAHPRQAFRREELMEKVWGWTFGDTATVTVHIRRLREKIEVDPGSPSRIATVWGVGYRFEG